MYVLHLLYWFPFPRFEIVADYSLGFGRIDLGNESPLFRSLISICPGLLSYLKIASYLHLSNVRRYVFIILRSSCILTSDSRFFMTLDLFLLFPTTLRCSILKTITYPFLILTQITSFHTFVLLVSLASMFLNSTCCYQPYALVTTSL